MKRIYTVLCAAFFASCSANQTPGVIPSSLVSPVGTVNCANVISGIRSSNDMLKIEVLTEDLSTIACQSQGASSGITINYGINQDDGAVHLSLLALIHELNQSVDQNSKKEIKDAAKEIVLAYNPSLTLVSETATSDALKSLTEIFKIGRKYPAVSVQSKTLLTKLVAMAQIESSTSYLTALSLKLKEVEEAASIADLSSVMTNIIAASLATDINSVSVTGTVTPLENGLYVKISGNFTKVSANLSLPVSQNGANYEITAKGVCSGSAFSFVVLSAGTPISSPKFNQACNSEFTFNLGNLANITSSTSLLLASANNSMLSGSTPITLSGMISLPPQQAITAETSNLSFQRDDFNHSYGVTIGLKCDIGAISSGAVAIEYTKPWGKGYVNLSMNNTLTCDGNWAGMNFDFSYSGYNPQMDGSMTGARVLFLANAYDIGSYNAAEARVLASNVSITYNPPVLATVTNFMVNGSSDLSSLNITSPEDDVIISFDCSSDSYIRAIIVMTPDNLGSAQVTGTCMGGSFSMNLKDDPAYQNAFYGTFSSFYSHYSTLKINFQDNINGENQLAPYTFGNFNIDY